MSESNPKPTAATPRLPSQSVGPREIPSTELFLGERSVVITHSGEQYRLMITRNDKLILQK